MVIWSILSTSFAATYAVDDAADFSDAVPGDGICAGGPLLTCSLRAAFQEAVARSGSDIIRLTVDPYLDLGSIDVTVSDDLVLRGGGHTVTKGVAAIAREGILLTLLDDSKFRVFNTRFEADTAGGLSGVEGAMIACRNPGAKGALHLSSTVFRDFNAPRGAAVSSTCHLQVRSSRFIGNVSTGTGGGALRVADANLDVEQSTFLRNTNQQGGLQIGGAIRWMGNDSHRAEIRRSSFFENGAVQGGGAIGTEGVFGKVLVENSTFVSNVAGGLGGAIYTSSISGLEIVSSTFVENQAGGEGGAVYSTGDAIFDANVFDTNVSLSNMASNHCGSSGVSVRPKTSRNVFSSDDCARVETVPDSVGAVSWASTSSYPTFAHFPATGSILHNAIPAAECPVMTDRLNRPRPLGGSCEVGAIEIP